MNRFGSFFKPLTWFMALLLAAFVAGCGGGGGDVGGVTGTTTTTTTPVVPGAAGTPGASATNPTVISSNPSSGATNVATSTNSAGTVTGKLLTATFSEAMQSATIISVAPTTSASTFSLKTTIAGTNVPGTVAMNAANTIATFTPTAALAPNTSFTATVSTAAKNAGGTAMPNPVEWSFTTGAVSTGLAPVTLGSAQNFAVIAAAGITNAAFATAITGDIGTSPTVAITGFPPGTVSGTQFTGNAASIAGLARADAGTAYQAALTAAAAPGFTTVAGNIGGTTRFPGAYHSTSSLAINATPLTLDAQGDPDAVWIFDMDSTLTTTGGGTVVLANGAQAKNVFWRVGNSATLGAAIFKGTILADTTIIVGTTAVDVAGRLFAGSVTASGAVNFNDAAHIVVRPAP